MSRVPSTFGNSSCAGKPMIQAAKATRALRIRNFIVRFAYQQAEGWTELSDSE